MKALVVFDSVYGNTEKIAASITRALAAKGDAKMARVSEIKGDAWKGVDVLVVGSPTQAFNALKSITSFLKGLPRNGLAGIKVAAFDTRMSVEEVNVAILKFFAKLFGFAAPHIEKSLVGKGGTLAAPSEGFFVKGSEGPLKDGELERAAAWANKLSIK